MTESRLECIGFSDAGLLKRDVSVHIKALEKRCISLQ